MKRNSLVPQSVHHKEFWQEHPALLYALSFLIGIAAFLFWHAPWNVLFPLFWGFYLLWLKRAPLLLLVGAGLFYSHFFYSHLPSSQTTSGIFSISSFQRHSTPFVQGFLYKGTLHLPETSVPCSIFSSGEDPPANCDYLIHGNLKERSPFSYMFKAENWHPVPNTHSLAAFRFRAKEKLRHFFSENLPTPRTAAFLTSLVTGESDDRLLRYEFGRLGLQHILAVSGFHFGVLIAFSFFFLGLFLPRFWKYLILLLAINAYFLFVGSNPAIQRSYLAAALYLIAKLFKRNTSGLNLLGAALFFELILDPLTPANLGFQLSFGSCIGILLFTPFIEKQIGKVLLKRTRFQVASLTLLSKFGYLTASFLRKAAPLTCAVNCTLLPILLYHFHTFPYLSLFYNLFFPFLVGVCLFLLLSSCIAHFLFAPVGALLFQITNFLGSRLLDLTSYPPLLLDYRLHITWLPDWSIPIYLFGLLAFAIRVQKQNALIF